MRGPVRFASIPQCWNIVGGNVATMFPTNIVATMLAFEHCRNNGLARSADQPFFGLDRAVSESRHVKQFFAAAAPLSTAIIVPAVATPPTATFSAVDALSTTLLCTTLSPSSPAPHHQRAFAVLASLVSLKLDRHPPQTRQGPSWSTRP